MRTQEKTEFISAAQNCISNFIQSMSAVQVLKQEYTNLNLGASIIDADFTGILSAAGLTAVEFNAALGSLVAIDTFLGTGTPNTHYQNLFKVKRA
jgi:hypothetical protein